MKNFLLSIALLATMNINVQLSETPRTASPLTPLRGEGKSTTCKAAASAKSLHAASI